MKKRNAMKSIKELPAKPAESLPSTVPQPPIVHAIGGSIGSALAIWAFYPLERIRVELQSQQQQNYQHQKKSSSRNTTQSSKETESIIQCLIRLYKDKSLYRGAGNMVMTLMISNFIFFYALQLMRRSLASFHHSSSACQRQRRVIRQRHLRLSKSLSSLLASTLAGVINVLLTNPLWVGSLRIMESKGKQRRKNNKKNNEVNMNHHDETNLWRVIHQIVKKEGFLQLWNGTISSLLLVSNPIIQHFLYEQLRTQLLSFTQYRMKVKSNTRAQVESTSSLTPLEAFVLGAISKTVATVVTYPLQLAQVLLRLQSSSSDACEIDKDEMSSENNTAADATTTTTTRPFDQLNKTTPYKGVMHCLRQQFSYGGICSLFQGMNAKLLSTVLTAALTFLSYEQTLLLAEKMHQALLNER